MVIDGKRKFFYGRTKSEVLLKIKEYAEKKEKGPLFTDLVDSWLEEHETKVTDGTMRPYRTAVKRLKKRFAGKYISEISAKELNNFIVSLGKQNLSHKTVCHHLSVINMIFRQAMIDGYIESNPAEFISIPRGLKKTPRELPSDEDIEKVKNAVNEPFGLLAYFALYTGMRKGELLALTYQDIDRKNKTISVNKSVYWKGSKPYLKEPKTEAGKRVIPLLDDLAAVLPNQHIGYVFPGPNNGLMGHSYFERHWNKYKKATGIQCGLHQLRHAMATFCFEAGLDEKDAQDILGHADITTTRNIYTHIREKRRSVNAQKLNDYLLSNVSQNQKIADNKAK